MECPYCKTELCVIEDRLICTSWPTDTHEVTAHCVVCERDFEYFSRYRTSVESEYGLMELTY